MCGIAGIMSLDGSPVARDELRAMCAVMVHRGPDAAGFYFGTGAGLGMRRLSIIDLKTGNQPVPNEDGSVWVVFNGEIYNFAELRDELRRRGHTFSTVSDTETIVHAYEEDGARCVERLRGMFALALWDERRRQLVLARGRVGINPLYWAEVDGRLLFASELKALLQLPAVDRDLNWRAVTHLFTFLSTPRSESIVRGIRKLEPGHRLVASPERGVRVERYWDVRFEPDRGRSEAYFVTRLRELIEESVTLHLVSDVELGAFLSGGMDSSTVVATMARLSRRPVKTFSIGFTEPAYNEPGVGRNLLRHRSLAGGEGYLDAATLFRQDDKRKLFSDEIFELISSDDAHREWLDCLAMADGGWLAGLQYLDLMGYLPLDILMKVDRMSMAHSLEARVPLLDHKIIEFAATIPPELRLRDGTTKYVLKRAVRDLLPAPLIDRRKQGFAIPLGAWFPARLDDFVRDLLLGETARRRAIFDPAYVERLLRRHARGRPLQVRLWTLISFELWCRTFLDTRTPWRASSAAEDCSSLVVGARP